MGDAGTPSPGLPAPRSLRMLIAARAPPSASRPSPACPPPPPSAAPHPGHLAAGTGEPAAVEDRCSGGTRRPDRAESDGRYAFSHAIVARCLYEEIEPAARGSCTGASANSSRQPSCSPARPATQLAHHWWRAEPGDRQRATRYCAEAGEAALRSYDHELAASWFERALERRGEDREDVELCDLLIGLGVALRYTNQERSRECLLRAARLADRLGEVDRLVAAALANHRGFVSQVGASTASAPRCCDAPENGSTEAARVGPGARPARARADLHRAGRPRRSLAESALVAARRSGDRRVLAQSWCVA